MFPYIVMFAHFLISFVVIFFAYKFLVANDKIKITSAQSLLAPLSIVGPAFAITFLGVPAFAGVVMGGVILFFLQRSYIKDDKKNALLALKTCGILILVIILILMASGIILG